MFKGKKNMTNGASSLIVFLLAIYSVFKGGDLSDIAETVIGARTSYLVMGATCVVLFMWTESVVLRYLFGILHVKTGRRACFMYSSVGFFFSCITPSAGGGQPAQVYYTRRDMAPMPVATMVLMAVTITYKLVLVIMGCLLVLFSKGLLNRYVYEAMPIFYLGLTLSVISCLAMLILAFRTSLTRNIMMKLLGFLVKLHALKDKTSRTEQLSTTVNHYNGTSVYLRQYKEVLIRVMFLTFYQRMALSSVVYFAYRIFGPTGAHMAILILLQSIMSISADMLPLPRSMGINEYLFLTIFGPIFYGNLLLPTTVLSKGIAYYMQLVLNAAMTLIARILIDKRQGGA